MSFSQLYGGKIAAALSRQHPRDLFDCKYMEIDSFDELRDGLLYCLAGCDKPIIESLFPHNINQTAALEQQFAGMTENDFSYADYEQARRDLHSLVLGGLTGKDRQFLFSLETGEPDWSLCHAGDLSAYSSVQWKMLNIQRLKIQNPKKYQRTVADLQAAIQYCPK